MIELTGTHAIVFTERGLLRAGFTELPLLASMSTTTVSHLRSLSNVTRGVLMRCIIYASKADIKVARVHCGAPLYLAMAG